TGGGALRRFLAQLFEDFIDGLLCQITVCRQLATDDRDEPLKTGGMVIDNMPSGDAALGPFLLVGQGPHTAEVEQDRITGQVSAGNNPVRLLNQVVDLALI